jgi:hypothetical protein
MGTLYRKTEKGLNEMTTRAHRLSPKLRAALIMVDGKRTDAELSAVILGEPEETLRWLTESGFIEPASGSANASVWGASVANSLSPGHSTLGTAMDGSLAHPQKNGAPVVNREPTPASLLPIEQIKRESVRALNDAMGPNAESLAIKMERTRSREELKPLLDMAQRNIANARGEKAAQVFFEKFIDGMMV